MSDAKELNRREQVKELIETGEFTKQEIADKLGVAPSSVSSQMTYLRWMGNFILADADKKLRFVTEEEAAAHEELVLAKRKTKATTSTKSPQEQANALAKTIKSQEAQYTKALAKCEQIDKDLALEPEDAQLIELKEEADANAVLLRIKIKRNMDRAETLPAPVAVEEPEVEEAAADIDETDEDLL